MANTIIDWLIGVLLVVFAVLLVIRGFGLVMSRGNPGALADAKKTVTDALIGLLIILSAWLIVDTLMRGLNVRGMTGGPLPWSQVQCQYQIQPTEGTTDSLARSGFGWGTSTANIGTGTPAIVNFAQQMQSNNCIYDQSRRNGCQGNPGYTDCSDLVHVAYRNAGCRSPGLTTAQQILAANPVGNSATLRPGDALIYRSNGAGHVVICQDMGCNRVIHAAGTGRNIVTSNGSSFLSRPDIQAIRAGDFCN